MVATEDEIAQLRRLTGLAVDDATYTDEVLGTYIDNLGLLPAAAVIWRERAASVAGLVDVTESGSSRKLSQLYSQFLKMGEGLTPEDDDDTTEPGQASFVVGIERV